MAQFSKTDQRRITFLSLLSTSATLATVQDIDPYAEALGLLDRMQGDGFFEEEVSPSSSRPSGRSARPASRSRSGNGGNRQSGGGFSGQMRDPDGPPTDKQVGKLLSLTEDYTEGEVYEMTKQEVSNLIDDLVG